MNERILLRKLSRILRVEITDLPKTLQRFKKEIEQSEKR